jgi:hypothetical protein
MGYCLKAKRRGGRKPIFFEMGTLLWPPLWSFVCREASDILTAKDAGNGSFNQGHSISADKAAKLAVRLDTLLRRRVVSAESRRHMDEARRERKKVCRTCRGRRTVLFRALPHSFRGPCLQCKGTGHPRVSPQFRTAWVREFAEFCRQSGGFRIY